MTKSYFAVPKNIKLNSTYYFVMKIPNKRELQQIVLQNHILFWLLILLLHQIILYVLERIL